MKKEMLVVAMFAALSFLVSVIVASPSFAVKATQTAPKSQQQPPTVQMKEQVKAKDKFWDLAVDHCVIDDFDPCGSTINVKKGSMTGKCFYNVKTIPVGDITLADVKAWGTGKSYTIKASLVNDGTNKSLKEEKTRKLPQFTWAEVQQWKSAGQGNAPKVWTEMLYFTWTATPEYSGSNSFSFGLDTINAIQEYGGELNNKCSGTISIN